MPLKDTRAVLSFCLSHSLSLSLSDPPLTLLLSSRPLIVPLLGYNISLVWRGMSLALLCIRANTSWLCRSPNCHNFLHLALPPFSLSHPLLLSEKASPPSCCRTTFANAVQRKEKRRVTSVSLLGTGPLPFFYSVCLTGK